MAPNPQNTELDNDCRTEIPITPVTTVDVGVCWEDKGIKFDDSGQRLINVDTRRGGNDSAWAQFGPTSNPGKPDGPYFGRDTDGDGYGNYGMQWYVPIKHTATGVAAVSGTVAAVATVASFSPAAPVALPIAAAFGLVAAGAGAVALVSDVTNLHQAIAFDVEPGALVDQAKDKAEGFLDGLVPDLPTIPSPTGPYPPVPFPKTPMVDNLRNQAGNIWDSLTGNGGETGEARMSAGDRISERAQSLAMTRVSEAFARLQSLL